MKFQRLIALCLLLIVCFICRSALAQTTLTAPYLLGCLNPAPAAAGLPTVFFADCRTPAFLPLTTRSVIGSVSKAAPIWSHTYGYYVSGNEPKTLLVVCPTGASLSADASKCLKPGTTTDASGLIPQSSVSSFSIAPPAPPVNPIPPLQDYTFSWTAPLTNTDGSTITDLSGYLLSTAATSLGPFLTWTMISSNITTYTFKALPTQEPACFAIEGFSASLGAGLPLVFCRPPVTTKPSAPTAK